MQFERATRLIVSGFALAACVTTAAAGGGRDYNRLLEGDYIYSGASACVFSPAGFNASFQPLGQSFTNTFTVNGIRRFNGDGTGAVEARAMTVNSGGASNNDFAGQFTYELNSDLTITIVSAPTSSTILTGPQAGQVFTLVNSPAMRGRVSEDLRTIHVMHYEPGIEAVLTPEGTLVNPRICVRERTLTRIERGRGHGHR